MKLTQSLANRLVTYLAVFVAVLLTTNLYSQTQAGRAEVRAVKGTATYTVAGGPPTPLKVGTVLTSGAVIKTGSESSVDLFLGASAGTLRLTENTTLGLDKLNGALQFYLGRVIGLFQCKESIVMHDIRSILAKGYNNVIAFIATYGFREAEQV